MSPSQKIFGKINAFVCKIFTCFKLHMVSYKRGVFLESATGCDRRSSVWQGWKLAAVVEQWYDQSVPRTRSVHYRPVLKLHTRTAWNARKYTIDSIAALGLSLSRVRAKRQNGIKLKFHVILFQFRSLCSLCTRFYSEKKQRFWFSLT